MQAVVQYLFTCCYRVEWNFTRIITHHCAGCCSVPVEVLSRFGMELNHITMQAAVQYLLTCCHRVESTLKHIIMQAVVKHLLK